LSSEAGLRNYLVYFYGYLAISLVGMVINTYLPVYYLNILEIPKEYMAIILLFASLILLIEPILSIIFDRRPKYTRAVIILGSVIMITIFSILLFTLQLLIMFGIFLSLSFAMMALIDSAIDKYIVAVSPNDKIKTNNVVVAKIGGSLGSIVAVLFYMILMYNVILLESWNQFFLVCIIAILPLVIIAFFLKKLESSETRRIEGIKELLPELRSRPVLLICVFFLFYSGNFLYDWVMEPWIVNTYGSGGFSLFNLFVMLWIAIYIIGFIVARMLIGKISQKSAIIYPMIVIGIFFIIGPYLDLITFLIMMTLGQFLAGIVAVNVMALLIDISQKKVVVFQFMFAFVIVAKIFYIPLGLWLYVYLPGELIITIAGCFYIICIFPLYFVENKK
jgi:MFS family permease